MAVGDRGADHSDAGLADIDNLRRRIDRPIVLVGMMGVGKTTIGRRLAKRLGLLFTDSDAEIEIAAGMSVAEIFAAMGEDEFRAGEKRVFTRLLGEGVRVIAAGGGAFAYPPTQDLIREKSFTIWLDADVDTLVSRTARRPGTRPLLTSAGDSSDPKRILSALMARRAPDYARADLRIVSGDCRHDTIVDRIVDGLAEHFASGQR